MEQRLVPGELKAESEIELVLEQDLGDLGLRPEDEGIAAEMVERWLRWRLRQCYVGNGGEQLNREEQSEGEARPARTRVRARASIET